MRVTKGSVVCREEDSNLRRLNQRGYGPLPLPLGYLGLRPPNDTALKRIGARQFVASAKLGVILAAIFIFAWVGRGTQASGSG